MKLQKIGIAFGASLFALGLSSGIAFSANTVQGSQATPAVPGAQNGAGVSADTPPELQSAQQRVELSKGKLEQAKQQLSAAKAMLKAADAEYKAARADQEALSLRTQARKLADASGLQDTVSTGTRLYPANVAPSSAAPAVGQPSASVGITVPTLGDVPGVTTPEAVDVSGGQALPLAAPMGAPVPQ